MSEIKWNTELPIKTTKNPSKSVPLDQAIQNPKSVWPNENKVYIPEPPNKLNK